MKPHLNINGEYSHIIAHDIFVFECNSGASLQILKLDDANTFLQKCYTASAFLPLLGSSFCRLEKGRILSVKTYNGIVFTYLQNYILFTISVFFLILNYSLEFANFSLDTLINYILIKSVHSSLTCLPAQFTAM